MGLHDEIIKILTKELLEKVAHFGAADVEGLKKNSEGLVEAFQKKISELLKSSLLFIDFFFLLCLRDVTFSSFILSLKQLK